VKELLLIQTIKVSQSLKDKKAFIQLHLRESLVTLNHSKASHYKDFLQNLGTQKTITPQVTTNPSKLKTLKSLGSLL
jgi:hypothetical protein